jgi:uncharacterized membrane protein
MRNTFMHGARRHMIAGLVVIGPVGITAYVIWWIFQLLDGLLGRFLYPALGLQIPGLGVVVLLAVIMTVGWIAELAIGARIVSWWHHRLEKLPMASGIYSASRRIVKTILGQERNFFRDVVLCEYPAPGRWALGFLTASAPLLLQEHVPDGVTVFIPKTPNPITGYLVVLSPEKVRPVAMTVEEAFTFLLSAGAVTPDLPPTPELIG